MHGQFHRVGNFLVTKAFEFTEQHGFALTIIERLNGQADHVSTFRFIKFANGHCTGRGYSHLFDRQHGRLIRIGVSDLILFASLAVADGVAGDIVCDVK